MKLSQLAKTIALLQEKHGDLDCLDYDNFSIDSVSFEEVNPTDYPKDWRMPEKLIRIGTFK